GRVKSACVRGVAGKLQTGVRRQTEILEAKRVPTLVVNSVACDFRVCATDVELQAGPGIYGDLGVTLHRDVARHVHGGLSRDNPGGVADRTELIISVAQDVVSAGARRRVVRGS